MPASPPDLYCDQFQLTFSPYGAALNFSLSSPTPSAPGTVQQAERLVSMRMSLEHLKHMAFILQRQVRLYEKQTGFAINLPHEVLNATQIGPEDWEAFWKQESS